MLSSHIQDCTVLARKSIATVCQQLESNVYMYVSWYPIKINKPGTSADIHQAGHLALCSQPLLVQNLLKVRDLRQF